MNILIESNVDAIAQVEEVVDTLPCDYYAREKVDGRSAVGSHVRHIIDHYRALQQGVKSGRIDYDCRHRNCLSATNRGMALRLLSDLKQWLKQDCQRLLCCSSAENLLISSESNFQESCVATMHSTLERELSYILNHTIHHVAYVSLLVQFSGFAISKDIGIAPTTMTSTRLAYNA